MKPYTDWASTNAAFHCPAYKWPLPSFKSIREALRGSYAWNAYGSSNGTQVWPLGWDLGLGVTIGNPFQPLPPVREWEVKNPSSMFAVSDSRLHFDGFETVAVLNMVQDLGGAWGVEYPNTPDLRKPRPRKRI